jgi:large subunit ribosomal protein L19
LIERSNLLKIISYHQRSGKKNGLVLFFAQKVLPLHRFPYNRWQDVEFPAMLCWDDKQFNYQIKMADLIKIAEEAFATGKEHPKFKAGDTITVAYKIVEGNKERIQLYRGVVIKISGHENKKRFTVRKMSGTVGVERIFPIESPNIESIEVNKIGKVRRAKLYYLRKLTGKKARIAEKRTVTRKEA